MKLNFILLASPFFALSIITEAVIALKNGSARYSLKDSVSNVSSVLIEELGALPFKGLILFSYYYISEHYPLMHIAPNHVLSWLLLWLGVDFCYYWYHRISHRCTFFWIGHSVHHQSEQFNFSVALRQGFLQTMTSWVFFLPLAFIGFPPWMFFIVYPLNSIYQFWIHTQAVDRMGWFEHVFNTPSHHRVHHGKNPQYIDKNYGGSLIIWDKFFGTFEPELLPVEYGVTEPLDSWNPFYANIKVITDILYYSKFLKNKALIILAFVMPPEWIINKIESTGALPIKRTAQISEAVVSRNYMLTNMVLILSLYAYLMPTFNVHSLLSWFSLSLVFLTVYILGKLSNDLKDIEIIEVVRCVIVAICLVLGTHQIGFALIFALLFWTLNHLMIQPKELDALA